MWFGCLKSISNFNSKGKHLISPSVIPTKLYMSRVPYIASMAPHLLHKHPSANPSKLAPEPLTSSHHLPGYPLIQATITSYFSIVSSSYSSQSEHCKLCQIYSQ